MILNTGLLYQFICSGQVSKWITGVSFILSENPKKVSIKSKLFLKASLINLVLSIAYLILAIFRVWSKNEKSHTRTEEQYYMVIQILLGMGFMLDFHFCIILHRQHSESENLIDEIMKLEERHFIKHFDLSPKEKKIIALTKFVFLILTHTLIQAIPLLATFVSVLVEDIPLNVFHCPPLSLVMTILDIVKATMNASSSLVNVARYAILISGNIIVWQHLVKFGTIAIIKVLLESVSLTMFLSVLQR